jgi:hypothetical protein
MQALLKFLSQSEVWIGGLGLAAFLALFWVLRGAPIGQAVRLEDDQDAPRGGYRDRVVGAVCIGMLLILFGAYLAVTRGIPWSLPAFALGFATVLALVLINRRYRHGSPTLRRTVDLSTAALNASLAAGILIVINVIAFRYGGRALDLTRDQVFSLSSLSRVQLKTLERPLTLTTFFGRSSVAVQQFDRVRQLLELYKAANPDKVTLNHVDPYRDLVRYDELVKRVPDVDVTLGGGVVIEYGEGESADRVVVRNNDLFDLPRPSRFDPLNEKYETIFKGENAITFALMRLREGKKPKIVLTSGHGEPSLDEMGVNAPGLGVWRGRMAATGMEVVEINLLTQDIPNDTALVAVVGPRTPFRPDELARLRTYSERKGPLLVVLGDSDTTGLEKFLKGFNVEVGKGFIVEPRRHYQGRAENILIPLMNEWHPILEPLNNELLLLRRAAPLSVAAQTEATPASGALVATVLLRTSPESWAEADLAAKQARKDEKDPSGPLAVCIAVNDRPKLGDNEPGAPRLVVFSSRYLADNATIQIAPASLDLLMNTVNWLRGRSGDTGIAPKVHDSLTLTADPVLRVRLIVVPTVMAVLLIITLGVTTYLVRRD